MQNRSKAEELLLRAADLVAGPRNTTHGDKESSFCAIAEMWTTYLCNRRQPYGPIRPRDVCQMISLLKKMRAEWGTPEEDHFVDDAGYSAIAGELSE